MEYSDEYGMYKFGDECPTFLCESSAAADKALCVDDVCLGCLNIVIKCAHCDISSDVCWSNIIFALHPLQSHGVSIVKTISI